jgi:hypothetical protein
VRFCGFGLRALRVVFDWQLTDMMALTGAAED